MRRIAVLAIAVLCLTIPSTASAERRVALVIGNGAYQQIPAQAKSVGDAHAIAAALGQLGFEVVSGFDLGTAPMRTALQDFADKAASADIALFFYAGHGLGSSGAAYLVPIDAAPGADTDLDAATLSVDGVLRQMRGAKAKIMVIDAPRDDPFARQRQRPRATTNIVDSAGSNTLIVFATEPGGSIIDSEGPHRPLTTALLKHLPTPGLEAGQMLRRVRRDVSDATGNRQIPWTYSALTDALYLAR